MLSTLICLSTLSIVKFEKLIRAIFKKVDTVDYGNPAGIYLYKKIFNKLNGMLSRIKFAKTT